MQLRWTEAAASDLERIADYLFEKTPENAAQLIRKIYNAPSALKSFPNRGRQGKKQGTRELVIPSLPYIVVYQITTDVVYIVRILHGAQDWPR
ncbi:MAG TPA: type II toxin-antitoxin system RelE/ParE family toxin [Candidatus Acidoferrum sp.]|nr:type II toxin-antitoxin system RelE/ParE family toxin [Candidatus Acidoferrum sp.]